MKKVQKEMNMKHLKGSYTKDRKRINLPMTVKQSSSPEMSKKEQRYIGAGRKGR